MSTVLERFIRKEPETQVQVHHFAHEEGMLDMLRRRDVDIAYSSVAKTPWGLTFTATRPLGIVLASPIGTNLPATVTFKSLDKLPMICPSPTEERRRLLDEPCERAGAARVRRDARRRPGALRATGRVLRGPARTLPRTAAG